MPSLEELRAEMRGAGAAYVQLRPFDARRTFGIHPDGWKRTDWTLGRCESWITTDTGLGPQRVVFSCGTMVEVAPFPGTDDDKPDITLCINCADRYASWFTNGFNRVMEAKRARERAGGK